MVEILWSNPSLIDSSTSIKHFFDSATNANIGKIARINQLLNDTNGVSLADLSAAQTLNNSITSPDTAESVYKCMYNIMLAMYDSGGQYTPYIPCQVRVIDSIAPLCPAQYGDGVFLARALLLPIDSVWLNTCGEGGGTGGGGEGGGTGGDGDHKAVKRTGQSIDSALNISAKVYPNPANTILTIEVSLSNGQIAYFNMYNNFGEEIENMQVNSGLTTLSISNLPSGIYYYRIIDQSDDIIKADKQMIIH